MVEKNTKFNVTAVPMWETKTGSLYTGRVTLKKEDIERIKGALEVGGTFIAKKNKFGKTEKSPQYYLEIISKADVDKFAASRGASDEI